MNLTDEQISRMPIALVSEFDCMTRVLPSGAKCYEIIFATTSGPGSPVSYTPRIRMRPEAAKALCEMILRQM